MSDIIDITEDAEVYFAENPEKEKIAIARALRAMGVDYEWDEEGDVVANVGDERVEELLYHLGEAKKRMVLKVMMEHMEAEGTVVAAGVDEEGLVKYAPGPNFDAHVDED